MLTGCTEKVDNEWEFLEAVDAFYKAVNAGDQAGHAALFTNDAFMLADGWYISRGEAIKKSIRERSGWVFRLKDIKHLDYGISGDLGYTVNEYYFTWHREGAQPEWHKTKNVHVWKKQPDDSWRLHVDIWNSTPEYSASYTD